MPDLPKLPKPHSTQAVRDAWATQRGAARAARATGDATAEWHHLERAHILGQPLLIAHVRTHLAMLGDGVRHRDRREIGGQIARLLVAGPGSAARRYPLGNTGGAAVSAVAPMDVPDDLGALLAGAPVVLS
jgi:hypothetical protein